MQRNLYQEWQDALKAPGFDVAQLEEIHMLYQAKLRREAEWSELWDECESERKAECEVIAQRVRGELAGLSKSQIIERYRSNWGSRYPKDFTKDSLIHDAIWLAQHDVRGTLERTKEAWAKRHST